MAEGNLKFTTEDTEVTEVNRMSESKIDPNDPVNQLSAQVIDAALVVHSALGPGLLETAYEACLVRELTDRGIKVERQVPVPVVFKGEKLDVGFRLDLLVGGCVIVEIKAVDHLAPIHKAQLLTYLKLRKLKVGLLLNFNAVSMRYGIKRVVL